MRAIGETFSTLHNDEMKIVQQSTMDNLLSRMTAHCHWRKKLPSQLQSAAVAHRARDYLYAHIGENVGLSDLARETGTDRFTLTRCFKREFNLAPHAWLIQLRLAKARQLLARGEQPVDVAAAVGFADQSHLGRWFQRAYRISPAYYRRLCTNLPDVSKK